MNHSKTKITIFVRSSSIFNWLIINSTKQITPIKLPYNAVSHGDYTKKLYCRSSYTSMHALLKNLYNQNGYLVIKNICLKSL